MFNNLLESKPKKQRQTGGTIASIVMHSFLIGLAIYATANAAIKNEKPRQEKIDFVETPKDEPPPRRWPVRVQPSSSASNATASIHSPLLVFPLTTSST